ncbi:MAG: T9SS type A sorting domain-containing protein [Ignavibacteria bacterium]|nr:T9SS type A sorting domain-containing protein [Ignavibacteria bacterium]
MKTIVLLLLLVVLPVINMLYSQENLTGVLHNPEIPYVGNIGDWGNDLVVANTESRGRNSGVYRSSNSSIYIAVSDTNVLAANTLNILRSSNNGATWSIVYSVGPTSIKVVKTRMIATANDSIYCYLLTDQSFIFTVSVLNGQLRPFNSGYRDFDVHTTPSSSMYLWVDTLGSNSLFRYGTTNGGISYVTRGNVTGSCAFPRVYCAPGSDTAIVTYYQAIAPITDTLQLGILSVRYRESAPGTAAAVGSFTVVIPAGTTRDQFAPVKYRNNAWIFYTTGTTGNIDMNCITSIDGGTTWGSQVVIGSLPSRDEYWFDARHYTFGSGGVDLIYYSDTLQPGAPTNATDRMYFTGATTGAPGTFSASVQFSEHAPGWSANGYIPFIVEYYDAGGDAAAVWIGQDGANKRLYMDRLQAVVGVSQNGNEIPAKYSLSQNYPNPFNPVTNITFALPVNGQVSLKVFDVMGREVADLVDKQLTAGSYKVNFDASRLSSGVYFYRLTTGEFTDTKKLMLIK